MSDAAADEADFYLRTQTGNFPFQVTEVIEPDRRRGDEYKRLQAELTSSLQFKPIRINDAQLLIEAAVERKVSKRYANAADLNLLLYVNVGVFGFPYTALVEAALPAAAPFSSCWAITSHMLACVQSDEALGTCVGWAEIR